MLDKVYTAVGSPNIAFVKYWGRRSGAASNLPNNSSVSMTLDWRTKSLFTVTSIIFSKKLRNDAFYIDGKEDRNPKGAKAILDSLRKRAKTRERALIVSYNSFPRATGIASSASGAATLAVAASKALDVKLNERELSILARESGSACRSTIGGFALWKVGTRSDGMDSYAIQIAKPNHWPELVDLICIVSRAEKKVSSSEGHERTVKTSTLYASRPKIAEANAKIAVEAIRRRDFHSLSEIIMKDSNSMHAAMLDSRPPIIYLNDKSRQIIEAIEELNRRSDGNMAAYTFDAGPNAHIIVLRKNISKVRRALAGIGILEMIESGPGPGPVMLDSGAVSLINPRSLEPTRDKDAKSLLDKI